MSSARSVSSALLWRRGTVALQRQHKEAGHGLVRFGPRRGRREFDEPQHGSRKRAAQMILAVLVAQRFAKRHALASRFDREGEEAARAEHAGDRGCGRREIGQVQEYVRRDDEIVTSAAIMLRHEKA
jgi:hypothetical protein